MPAKYTSAASVNVCRRPSLRSIMEARKVLMPGRVRHRAPTLALTAVLLLLTAGARSSVPTEHSPQRPIVVLIGLDGFLPRYLDRPESRQLRELASEGVRARWLVPVFPTLT